MRSVHVVHEDHEDEGALGHGRLGDQPVRDAVVAGRAGRDGGTHGDEQPLAGHARGQIVADLPLNMFCQYICLRMYGIPAADL